MPTSQRRQRLSVIQRLLDEPYRFELVQALRMLDLWLRQNGVAHDVALLRYVRFHNSVSMNFPASQIEALAPEGEHVFDSDQALQDAFIANTLKRICITPAYMSFLGAHGVMPHRYTEGVATQIHQQKHEGARAFFDIFFNRIMTLHYQAWAKYRVRHRLDARGDDALLAMQLALAGRHRKSRSDPGTAIEDDEGFDEAAAYYAALFAHRPTSARLVAGVLAEYFGVPIIVKQFIGRWDKLAETELFKLGVQNATFGQGATLGTRVWERRSRVELRIGPLSMAQFEQFLPGASCFKALKRMLGLFAIPSLEFEMRLVLRAAEVKPMRLGAASGARLGMGAFLITKPETRDRDDLVYELRMQK